MGGNINFWVSGLFQYRNLAFRLQIAPDPGTSYHSKSKVGRGPFDRRFHEDPKAAQVMSIYHFCTPQEIQAQHHFSGKTNGIIYFTYAYLHNVCLKCFNISTFGG